MQHLIIIEIASVWKFDVLEVLLNANETIDSPLKQSVSFHSSSFYTSLASLKTSKPDR